MLRWSSADSCLKAVFYCLTDKSAPLTSRGRYSFLFPYFFFFFSLFLTLIFPSFPYFPLASLPLKFHHLSLHHLYFLTHLNPFFSLCCALAESIKAVARSERSVLLSALSQLLDPIKLLIGPFRRLRPPTALIIHPKIQTLHSPSPSIFQFCSLFLALPPSPLHPSLLHLKLAGRC